MISSTRDIAHSLGGQVTGANTVLCPGPNHSPQDRSLAVHLDPKAPSGFVCFSHCGDDWRDCRDHVLERLGLPVWQPSDKRRRIQPSRIAQETNEVPRSFSEAELGRIGWAQNIWSEAQDPRGTLAEVYLREHRKLDLPDELCGTVLRFHPGSFWRDKDGNLDRVPMLVAPFTTINGNDITAVHRIALNPDGSKIERRMLGVCRRVAIKLDVLNPAAGNGTLVIGEGLETCLACRQYMARGEIWRMPVWAVGSAGAISFFPLIDGIKKLFICGENNDGGANQRAVTACRMHWNKHGRKVAVIQPEQAFDDINDALIATLNETVS
jgi:hypothetical protein